MRQLVGTAGRAAAATAPALAGHTQDPSRQDDASPTEKPANPGRASERGVRVVQGRKLLLGLGIGALQVGIFRLDLQILRRRRVLTELLILLAKVLQLCL